MEEMQKELNDMLGPPSGNIWGWKWSYISLVIILIGFAFLLLIGPKEGWDQTAPTEPADTTLVE